MLTEAHIRRLASINSIEALLAFLREELEWPLAEGSVEDVTFGYEADELGLKDEHAPKVNKIYQVRNVTAAQPWGIFFIDFENKRLPVTILRRILNLLRLKKRGTSGQWDAGDLLFMTTYGEEAEGMREVAFAHFHQQAGDLPTLNVLQWDAQDTPDKLRTTYDTLKSNLGWPPDPSDADGWRDQWRAPFKHGIGHTIKTSRALASALAVLSRSIRDSVNQILEAENDQGRMTKLYKAFKDALLHDLEPDKFADTFAQTVSYGLLIAAFSRTPEEGSGHTTTMRTEDAPALVPPTNPFLKEVLETFIYVGGRNSHKVDFDELGIQSVVELLNSPLTDIHAIQRDFGNRKPGEDPVIHFYEDYLAAYDKPERKKRGVFYTPQPVVSYIVRSVHELLQTEFGLEDGLASTITWGEMASRDPKSKIQTPKSTDPDSHFVVILDPATGTATFLVEVIDVIWKHLRAKWDTDRAGCLALLRSEPTRQQANEPTFQGFWNSYVPDHLLPRLYGYELMMAPYAIAHMKVGLKLAETGYTFGTDRRVRIYLTNALEPASELQARLALDWEALAHEAMAVKAVKETQRFTVVIGNPPYSGHSANASKDEKGNRNFIGNLVHDYYFVDGVPLGEKNPKWLQDDYVKFLRFGQYLIQQADVGVLGMITNHGYLDNPTFRGMRRSLMQTFDEMLFLDLHGNAKKKEVSPDGSKDENVFDILQGVAVCHLLRRPQVAPLTRIAYGGLFGARNTKYDSLTIMPSSPSGWETLAPNRPHYLFEPQDQAAGATYDHWWKITDVSTVTSVGVVTGQDDNTVTVSSEDAYRLASGHGLSESVVQPYQYRPFDFQHIVYDSSVVTRTRFAVMTHMIGIANKGLVIGRSGAVTGEHEWNLAFASGAIPDFNLFYRGGVQFFPFRCFPRGSDSTVGVRMQANLSRAFLNALTDAIGRPFEPGSSPGGLFAGGEPVVEPTQPTLGEFGDGLSSVQGSLSTVPDPAVHPAGPTFSPEDVFHYIYAVLHSPTYRSRYAEFLKIDFPRIPLPGGPEVFDALVPLGAELVALHLMESTRLDQPMTTLVGVGKHSEPRVEKVTFTANTPTSQQANTPTGTVWLDKAQTTGFQGVPEEVWNFHIGGYQVCEKWLKDRDPKKRNPGRILTPDDISHYHKIVVALSETIRIMNEIDIAIDANGGWPEAFRGTNHA